jgi:hypothetical protein
MKSLMPGLRTFEAVGQTSALAVAKFRILYIHELMAARYTTNWETAKEITRKTVFTAYPVGGSGKTYG